MHNLFSSTFCKMCFIIPPSLFKVSNQFQINQTKMSSQDNQDWLLYPGSKFWLITISQLVCSSTFCKMCFIVPPSLFKIFYHFQIYQTKMSSQDNPDWRMLGQDHVFQKIMMMVGLDSLESLQRCEKVCTAWNDMIMQNIWESSSERNIIKMRIEKNWAPSMYPSDEDISNVKWLGNNNNVVII